MRAIFHFCVSCLSPSLTKQMDSVQTGREWRISFRLVNYSINKIEPIFCVIKYVYNRLCPTFLQLCFKNVVGGLR